MTEKRNGEVIGGGRVLCGVGSELKLSFFKSCLTGRWKGMTDSRICLPSMPRQVVLGVGIDSEIVSQNKPTNKTLLLPPLMLNNQPR